MQHRILASLFLVAGLGSAAAATADEPLYTVVEGSQVDAKTYGGFKAWRAANCAQCHGANQEGAVGPPLVESLKVLTKAEFVTTVTNGRLEKGMPNWSGNPTVMANIDGLYAYLKGRSEGKITIARVTQIPMNAALRLYTITAALALAATLPAFAAEDAAAAKTFKVCRNPNNLPFSNSKGEGYEDKIAEVLAADLGEKAEYYEFASPFNFIRNTLKFKLPGEDYHCDVVIGVPSGFDQVAQTKPYFRSTYALVIPQGRKLDKVKTAEDFLALPQAELNTLKIGVIDRSPASDWLVNHGLLELGVPYKLLVADVSQNSGQIIEEDLRAGKIDAAIVWGPIAGYYAKRSGDVKELVLPLKSEKGVKFDFDIAMGVRFGEKDWKAQVDGLIERNRPKILAILADYGVPVVPIADDAAVKVTP